MSLMSIRFKREKNQKEGRIYAYSSIGIKKRFVKHQIVCSVSIVTKIFFFLPK